MNFAALLEWGGARAWHASYQAGWLILLVWALQRLLRRKLSPRWRYALWFPVLLRLALPITPVAPFSLFRGVPSWEASSSIAVGALASKSTALVRSSADRAQVSPGPVSPRDTEAAVAGDSASDVGRLDPDRDASPGFGVALAAVPSSPRFAVPASPGVVGTTAEFPNSSETAKNAGRSDGSRRPLGVAWAIVWATGTCLGLAYAVGGWIWLRVRVRRYRPVTDPVVLRWWEGCREAMGVRGSVRLVEAVDGAGPALLGPGGCTLLLPAGFASRFEEDALRHVFLHELAHLRRGDLWANAAMVVLQAVHWFNPWVWFALARVRAAREEAADALALDHAGSDEARRYGLTILRIVEEAVAARPLPGWVGILDEPKRLAERIEAIAGFRSGSGSIRWPMVLCLALGLVGLTDARRSVGAAGAVVENDAAAARGVVTNRVAAAGFHAGPPIGGVVRDGDGHPIEGIRIEVTGRGSRTGPAWQPGVAEVWRSTDLGVAIRTGADGRWAIHGVPEAFDAFDVDCLRPDGMVHRFGTRKPQEEHDWYGFGVGTGRGAPIALAAFRRGDVSFVLPEGTPLRGRVLDPEGKPMAGIRVRAAFGHERRMSAGETTTDAGGRFVFAHRTPIEWIVTAEAPGLAVASVVVDPAALAEGKEVELRLERGVPLRVRVEDDAGQAVGGAGISVDARRSGPQILEVSGETDRNGRWSWPEAPRAPFALRVRSAAPDTERVVRLGVEDRDVVVRLRSGARTNIVVKGRAVEEGTGRPMEVATVAFRASTSSEFSTVALETLTLPGDGRFRLGIPADWFHAGDERRFQLRLWAPGVGRVVTDWRDFDEGDSETTVRFRRGGNLQGTVRLPDGRPASGAVLRIADHRLKPVTVRFAPDARDPWLLDEGSEASTAHAEADGRYGMDDPGEDVVIVILHREGFAEFEVRELRKNSDPVLKPLGRIEGVLRSEGRPVPGQRVILRRDAYGRFDSPWSLILGAETGADGSFVFAWVPPGNLVLNRFIPMPDGGGWAESHPQRVRIEAGATVRVNYGGEGRRVEGRWVGPNPEAHAKGLRWVSKRTVGYPELPDPDDFATPESYRKHRGHFLGLNEYWAGFRTYGIEFGADGQFRVEDVTPGAYVLEWTRRASSEGPEVSPSEPRTLWREFEVPTATPEHPPAVVDLGAVNWEEDGTTGRRSEEAAP